MTKRAGTFFVPSALILLIIFMLSACASTEDVGKVRYGLNELQRDVQDLKRRSDIMESEIPKSRQMIDKKLEGTKDSQEATARAVSNLFIKVQDFSGELQQVTGSIEEIRHLSENIMKDETAKRELLAAEVSGMEVLLEDLKAGLKEIRADMETAKAGMDDIKENQDFIGKKLVRMEKRRIPPKKNVTQRSSAKKAGPAKKKAKADVKDLYNAAYKLYGAGKYEEARVKFMSVLQDYEDNEHSGDARFFVGDCYFREKKYEDSILAFEEFLEDADSDRVPTARLKQGVAFYELDDPDTGEYILKNLIEMFPDSDEAVLAGKKLGTSAAP